MSAEHFQSFEEFYPFYITEHQNKISRTLHFIGTFIVLILVGFFIVAQKEAKILDCCTFSGLWFCLGWSCFFEKNKPATFKYPLWSLRGDFKLFFEILLGKRGFDTSKD